MLVSVDPLESVIMVVLWNCCTHYTDPPDGVLSVASARQQHCVVYAAVKLVGGCLVVTAVDITHSGVCLSVCIYCRCVCAGVCACVVG